MTKIQLIFENGRRFDARCFTKNTECCAELVFNTAMTGYQEILTDPSYKSQIVLMTYPLIGNYGANAEDRESNQIFASGIIVKSYCDRPSNWRSDQSLKEFLDLENAVGIEGVDTRSLTRCIRESGAQNIVITSRFEDADYVKQLFASTPSLEGQNLAKQVSTKSIYRWPVEGASKYKVAVLDCGVKQNILNSLARRGCESIVFPVNTPLQEILSHDVDGLLLSNGPGDPAVVEDAIQLVKDALGKLPIFGICLGHQILGLALGLKTYKLKFGHHGANHPIKNLKTARIEVTSQNHGFCIDPQTIIDDQVEVTHVNLNDGTIAGIRHKEVVAFSVQYHPEASPGPHDSQYLFDEFVATF